jgi:hypothetical protein
MAKILKATELGEIVAKITKDDLLIDDADQYKAFLEDLADLVARHCGGEAGAVSNGDDLGWTVAINHDESVPQGGGVYAEYDKDEDWDEKEV